jgi:hypothetical protein
VRQQLQEYLVKALANARATKCDPRVGQRTEVLLASFSGQLSALRFVDEITAEEVRDSMDRMRVALGITRQPDFRRGSPVPANCCFMRSIPGPDAEYDLCGARLRVLAVDVYDKMVTIKWRVAPKPDVVALFPDVAVQLVARKVADRHRVHVIHHNFRLADDVGTPYDTLGGGGGATGESLFAPQPPDNASMLTITWLPLEVDVPLS